MIDIHTHILPGIDDGARDLTDTLEMAQIAVESGTTDMVATPHCNLTGRYDNYFDTAYREVFLMAKKAIEKAEIPLRLYPGAELYTTEEAPALFRNEQIMPLNASHYLLMEFDFDGEPDFAERMLGEMRDLGVIPVVAHIVRYHFVQEIPELARIWHDKGYVIQCNKGSFQGRFGREEKKLAYRLMDERLVDVIASDTHRPNVRTPDMRETYRDLQLDYPESYLKRIFRLNPGRILSDRPIQRIK